MKTLNLTEGQLEYLQELVMFGYEMEVPEQKGWDIQTYDNLVDEVMKLYEGNQIESLATRGLKLEPICEGLESCIERLEGL